MFNFFKKKTNSTDTPEAESIIVEDYSNTDKIAEYFQSETGITFQKQQSILKNKLTTFCRNREIYTFDKLLDTIKRDQDLKQELIDYLTTNESFFYREFSQIEQLVNLVKNKASKVDILCAPSSTGEEPYSIVIALLEAGVSPSKFDVLGIDINAEAISKAKSAIYRERNIRNLSQEVLSKYFTQESENYSLNDSVKSQVTYRVVNLFDSSFSSIGKFDFIFSRNMLIYFDKETKLKAKEVLESLRKDSTQEIFFGHADLF